MQYGHEKTTINIIYRLVIKGSFFLCFQNTNSICFSFTYLFSTCELWTKRRGYIRQWSDQYIYISHTTNTPLFNISCFNFAIVVSYKCLLMVKQYEGSPQIAQTSGVINKSKTQEDKNCATKDLSDLNLNYVLK